jgi:hypothetical protein
MSAVLLPLAIAISLLIGTTIDPLRIMGGVIIGSRDPIDQHAVKQAALLSFALSGIYLLVFGWRYSDVTEFLLWLLVIGPMISIYAAIAISWTRRIAQERGLG